MIRVTQNVEFGEDILDDVKIELWFGHNVVFQFDDKYDLDVFIKEIDECRTEILAQMKEKAKTIKGIKLKKEFKFRFLDDKEV